MGVRVHSGAALALRVCDSDEESVECACGSTYAHDTWCSLLFLYVALDGPTGRVDVRECPCGQELRRSLPVETSVCIECTEWTGPKKTVSMAGVVCDPCALRASGAGRTSSAWVSPWLW